MPFLPHTDDDRRAMLATIGIESLDELFHDIPAQHRYPDLNLPEPASEIEILDELRAIAAKNQAAGEVAMFLGAGAYHHFVPSVVPYLASRGEYATAYTPYQAEVSQGTLQVIFEYQSMLARLTGMEVVNASHYDGATAMAEAALMAVRVLHDKRNKIVVSPSIHPHYRQTLRTYVAGGGEIEITGDEDLSASPQSLLDCLDDTTACLVVQHPDFFGRLVDLKTYAQAAHRVGALLVVVSTPITSLGMLKPPGAYGADIVAAEGQPLGIPLSFGGPYLGVLACLAEYVRKIPGRLVGETVDEDGRRGFVLTLTPREQHIRREKATSNICTNQGLMALMSTIYLAYMGPEGLRQIASLCYHRAHYAAREIDKLPGYRLVDDRPFFNEFAIECPGPVSEINQGLLSQGLIGGYELESDYPDRRQQMLLCLTEMNSRSQIDRLIAGLKEVAQ